MRIAVISYSLTGNNDALAASIARELQAEHIRITEPRKRGWGRITLDLLLNRAPEVSPSPQTLVQYGGLIFVAPVWMGQPAFPLRGYMKYLSSHPCDYGFATISGGSLNPNPQLRNHLIKLTGKEPRAFVDLYISDLLPKDMKADPKAVEAYRLTEGDLRMLTEKAVGELEKSFC
ncbi:MAG: hypothetical protein QM697_04280 [Lachnospiraceae bacterium]